MQKNSVPSQIEAMSRDRFKQLCEKIIKGLGFAAAREISLSEMPIAFQQTIERTSTDGMFCTKESWLLAFARPSAQSSLVRGLQATIREAWRAETQNVLVIAFGNIEDPQDVEKYHTDAKVANLRSILLMGDFAYILAQDYAEDMFRLAEQGAFSFAKLRGRTKQQVMEAPWHKQFISVSTLPIRASKIHRKDTGGKETVESSQDILDEADLFGAIYKTQSFLLLGDPGGGKTTCLQKLAEELANVGGRTPVFLPLNRYEGNLLRDLGETLCGEADQLSEQEVEDLLSSGGLTVILDGVNEVQSQTLQSKLIKEINTLTNPDVATARSHWIISSRRYDYTYVPQPIHLDKDTWELLSLTPDLVYQFLKNALGEQEAKIVYGHLGSSLREVCSNPLLLNMLLSVRNESGTLFRSRGALYHQFIDLLLYKGAKIPNNQRNLADLSMLMGSTLTLDAYCHLAYSVLADLANEMQDKGITAIGSSEMYHVFSHHPALASATQPEKAGEKLRDSLLSCGILRFTAIKIMFLHHTFQEYFHATKLREMPFEDLIPPTGIFGARREAIVFMASTLESPNKLRTLIEYVLRNRDGAVLAYEIMLSASISVDRQTPLKVASAIWKRMLEECVLGANRRLAQILDNLAREQNQSVEQLLRDVLNPLNEDAFTANLLRFYQEIGDLTAQKRLLHAIDLQPNKDISDNLLSRIAISSAKQGDYYKAIELYTQYIKRNPNSSLGYHNRAVYYEFMENREKAEVDYKQAIALLQDNPSHYTHAVYHTNYAIHLIRDNREEQALEELMIAVKSEKRYHQACFELGRLLEAKDPLQALDYLEEAINLTSDPNEQTQYLQELLKMQEKEKRFAGAMISIRRLIDLNPTSPQVKKWKEKYADLRLRYSEEAQEIREGSLVRMVLHTAGWRIDHQGLQWIQAVSDEPGRVSPLSVLLLEVPQLTEALVQERITALQNEEKEIKYLVLLTTAEVVDQEAYIYLAQRQYPVAFITAVELHEARMRGDQACYRLFDNAFTRANARDNPFMYTGAIQVYYEFFGRKRQTDKFISFILQHQLVGLYGIHKIGKSSFLRQVRRYLTVYRPNITSVSIEMSSALKKPRDLYQKILGELYGETGKFWTQELLADQFQHQLYTFHKSKQHNYTEHQILLILDEYPYLIPGRSGERGIADYMEVLGVLKVLSQEGWFNFLPCGRTSALSRTPRWPEGENPFIGLFQEQFLEPLARDEAEELINKLGSRARVNFSNGAIDRMWALAGGHPFLTRTLGSWVLQKLSKSAKNPTASVTEIMVDDVVAVFLNSSSESDSEKSLLQKIYRDELEDEEQRIVKILARSDRPLPRIALIPDNASEEDRHRVRMAVENLLATSVLQEDEQRRLGHRYELLRRVIVQDMAWWE